MTPNDVERVYDALAETLDRVGTKKSELFLAQLAMLLANEIGDVGNVLRLVHMASHNLEVTS
jgi:hypothetical protein